MKILIAASLGLFPSLLRAEIGIISPAEALRLIQMVDADKRPIVLDTRGAGSSHNVWRLSRSPALNMALPGLFWKSLGLPSLTTTTT